MELTDAAPLFPAWVKQGEKFHRQEERLWQRRNLSRFGLEKGEKHYNLNLQDGDIGMHGVVDMAIETEDAVYAVEFKLSHYFRRGHQLQLVAYALLLEKHFLKPSLYGFLVGTGKNLHVVNIDVAMRQAVEKVVRSIRKMLDQGKKPSSSATTAQCGICEYLNFCNDRL